MEMYKLTPVQHCTEVSLEDLTSAFAYGYLFEETSLKELEKYLLDEKKHIGMMAKGLLNFCGVETSTSSGNRGIYLNRSVIDVAPELMKSEDKSRRFVGELLWHYQKEKYLDQSSR